MGPRVKWIVMIPSDTIPEMLCEDVRQGLLMQIINITDAVVLNGKTSLFEVVALKDLKYVG